SFSYFNSTVFLFNAWQKVFTDIIEYAFNMVATVLGMNIVYISQLTESVRRRSECHRNIISFLDYKVFTKLFSILFKVAIYFFTVKSKLNVRINYSQSLQSV